MASKTKVNDKAASPESMDSIPDVTPGQSIQNKIKVDLPTLTIELMIIHLN